MEKCAVHGCLSSLCTKDRSFYRFPKDEDSVKKWIKAAGRPDLQHATVESLNRTHWICDLHFDNIDQLGRGLSCVAVPTKLLSILDATGNLAIDKSTQTNNNEQTSLKMLTKEIAFLTEIPPAVSTTPAEPTPKKRKLEEDKNSGSQGMQLSRLEVILHLQNQLKLGKNPCKGASIKYLKFYLANPNAYRVFRKTLGLPSESSLCNVKIGVGLKLESTALDCLATKFKNFKKLARHCVISAGLIPLRPSLYYQIKKDRIIGFHEIGDIQTPELATVALVVMAQGIFSTWKQPLAYCFLPENKYTMEINAWLEDIISKVLGIGLDVVAFVSDQSPVFLTLANELNVSDKKPFFYVNGKKIYYIFDLAHLVRSLRNDLIDCDFGFLGADETTMTAKWEHVNFLYEYDCKRTIRLAPQLTESHISPDKFEKMNTKYVLEVFSKPTAAAMNFAIECGQLDESALGTVVLIYLISKTIAILNSTALKNTASPKLDILNKFVDFLSNVIIISKKNNNVTVAAKHLKCWKITIKSLKNLLKDLKSVKSRIIFTRRLNQRAFEKSFVSMIQTNKECRKPTPFQFTKEFRRLYMVNLMKHSSTKCSNVLDPSFIKTDEADSSEISNGAMNTDRDEIASEDSGCLPIRTADYRFSLPKREGRLIQLSGYLFKKCFEIHKCEGMTKYIESNCKPEAFIACIRAMDDRFKCFFQYRILNPIGSEILKEISDIYFLHCCVCFPNNYLRKLFVRFRIYYTLRLNNKLFKNGSLREKSFKITDI